MNTAGAMVLASSSALAARPASAYRVVALQGPGATLHRLLERFGHGLERFANRLAHKLDLGPIAASARIECFFGVADARLAALERMRRGVDAKLLNDCRKLICYTAPTEACQTRCDAFKRVVKLTTLFPGLRRVFLDAAQETGAWVGLSQTLWDRDAPENADPECVFWYRFAAACLFDNKISSVLETCLPSQWAAVPTGDASRSVVEQLIVALESLEPLECALALRYLNGVLELPSFWRGSGRVYCDVLKKVLQRVLDIVEDLADERAPHDPQVAAPPDPEGRDMLVLSTATGTYGWMRLPARRWTAAQTADLLVGGAMLGTYGCAYPPALWSDLPGFERGPPAVARLFRRVVERLRHPHAEAFLPRSWQWAASEELHAAVPTTAYRVQPFDVFVRDRDGAGPSQPHPPAMGSDDAPPADFRDPPPGPPEAVPPRERTATQTRTTIPASSRLPPPPPPRPPMLASRAPSRSRRTLPCPRHSLPLALPPRPRTPPARPPSPAPETDTHVARLLSTLGTLALPAARDAAALPAAVLGALSRAGAATAGAHTALDANPLLNPLAPALNTGSTDVAAAAGLARAYAAAAAEMGLAAAPLVGQVGALADLVGRAVWAAQQGPGV
ncbi:hypothetical protein B0H15DRAFT_944990 [Mycena belliarum]|uniref:Uncharacterized protein n=1 Tax=Mycena belliarum TaxID=1033014 RepID=A0AAD6UFP1_9AGAR|nr:hypothetical protein B0H15DRAFT_944990 [Mycena belliae]